MLEWKIAAKSRRRVVGALVGVLVLAAFGSQLATAGKPSPALKVLGISGGDPAALLHVSLLAEPPGPRDQAPAALVRHLAITPDPAHTSRYLGSINRYAYYAVPGVGGTMCVGGIRSTAAGDYTVSSCDSDADLIKGAIWVAQVDTDTGVQYVAGVAPDAFTRVSTGKVRHSIARNGFTMALARRHVLRFSGAGFKDRAIDIGAFTPLSERDLNVRAR